jgi:hypothetical protein
MSSKQPTSAPTSASQGRVPPHVIAKLIFFAFALAFLPIASYFVSVDRIFSGNATYAGALAGVVANVVLIGYVIVAFMEEDVEAEAEKKVETKKTI